MHGTTSGRVCGVQSLSYSYQLSMPSLGQLLTRSGQGQGLRTLTHFLTSAITSQQYFNTDYVVQALCHHYYCSIVTNEDMYYALLFYTIYLYYLLLNLSTITYSTLLKYCKSVRRPLRSNNLLFPNHTVGQIDYKIYNNYFTLSVTSCRSKASKQSLELLAPTPVAIAYYVLFLLIISDDRQQTLH